MVVYLIRHGKTAATEQKLYCGATDLPLSDDGVAYIKYLMAEGVYPPAADLYFTSGMKRAEQTLSLIYGQVNRTILPELAEYNFGDFEMQLHEQLTNRCDYQAWIGDRTGRIACPGGESREQFARRVLAGYAQIVEISREVETVLAICHGGSITCIMDYLFPDAQKSFYDWYLAPGHGYKLTYDKQGSCWYTKLLEEA